MDFADLLSTAVEYDFLKSRFVDWEVVCGDEMAGSEGLENERMWSGRSGMRAYLSSTRRSASG